MSLRLVIPMTRILLSCSTPSILDNNWFTTVSWTPVPPPTLPLCLQMASISSKIIICRPEFGPSCNIERQWQFIQITFTNFHSSTWGNQTREWVSIFILLWCTREAILVPFIFLHMYRTLLGKVQPNRSFMDIHNTFCRHGWNSAWNGHPKCLPLQMLILCPRWVDLKGSSSAEKKKTPEIKTSLTLMTTTNQITN